MALRGPAWLDRLVIEPEDVARAIVRSVERDRREVYVPWWYRLPAVAQAVAPGLLARALSRHGYKGHRQ